MTTGPGAYTPKEPQSPAKRHRPPESSANLNTMAAIACLAATQSASPKSLATSSVAIGPGAYTPKEPQSPAKRHRPPESSANPNTMAAIAALHARLRSSRRAAGVEATAVEEVVRAAIKHGDVEVSS